MYHDYNQNSILTTTQHNIGCAIQLCCTILLLGPKATDHQSKARLGHGMKHTTHVRRREVCCIIDCSVAKNHADSSLTLMQSSLSAGSSYYLHPVTCRRKGAALYCASRAASHTHVTWPWRQCLQVHQLGRYADMLSSKM